jgi:hypothetical protein
VQAILANRPGSSAAALPGPVSPAPAAITQDCGSRRFWRLGTVRALIGTIGDPDVIRKILVHLGLARWPPCPEEQDRRFKRFFAAAAGAASLSHSPL